MVDESVLVSAPAAIVWQALVTTRGRAGWWPYLELDARPGGRFEERWRDASGAETVTRGEVVGLEPEQRLALEWADEGWPAATRVELRLRETGVGTVVRVLHSGWEALPDGTGLVEAHRQGWRQHLCDLRAYAEG